MNHSSLSNDGVKFLYYLKDDNDFDLEGLHGGEEDGEGCELDDVEHHHVLVRLLAAALGVGPQARPLYHNLQRN